MTDFYVYSDGQDSTVLCEDCLQDWLVNAEKALIMENCEINLDCDRLSNPKFSFNRLQDMTIFCPDCFEVYGQDKEIHKIFDTEEWDYYPTCEECNERCEDVILTQDGLNLVKEEYCKKYKLDFTAYNPSGVVVFFDIKENVLCKNCATEEINNALRDLAIGYEPYGLPINQGFIYEDIDKTWDCDNCGRLIFHREDEE